MTLFNIFSITICLLFSVYSTQSKAQLAPVDSLYLAIPGDFDVTLICKSYENFYLLQKETNQIGFFDINSRTYISNVVEGFAFKSRQRKYKTSVVYKYLGIFKEGLILSCDQYFYFTDFKGNLLYQTGMYSVKPKHFYFLNGKDKYTEHYPLFRHFQYTGKELILNITPLLPEKYTKHKGVTKQDRLEEYLKTNYHLDSFHVHYRHPLLALAQFELASERKKNLPEIAFWDYKHCIPFRNFIGQQDSVFYIKHLEGKYNVQLSTVNFIAIADQKKIFLNQAVNEMIKIYDYQGQYLCTFGKSGKHLGENDSIFWLEKKYWDVILSAKDQLRDEFHQTKNYMQVGTNLRELQWRFKRLIIGAKYASRRYGSIYYDSLGRKTYRLYYPPALSFSEFCRLNVCDSLEQILFKSPTYLQIYDHNDGDKLIYDERVPAPFHILEVKGDTLWAVAGITDKGLKIVKYHLKKE